MNLLLDTHIFIWWCGADPQITQGLRTEIEQADKVFVSMASAWEAAIKVSLGKLRLPLPFPEGIEASGFSILPIAFLHADQVASLPRHHGDPFDRMLIAQAQVEGLTLVTADPHLQSYDVPILWA